MYMIGENIHIISPRVKEALTARDGAFFTELARRQVGAGAQALDLNIGPRNSPRAADDSACNGTSERMRLAMASSSGSDTVALL